MSKSTRDSLSIERTSGPYTSDNSKTITTDPGGEPQVFLDEEMVGVSNDTIGFPDLVLCQGVVCAMSDGTMVGAHFSSEKSEVKMLNLMVNEIQKHGGPSAIQQVTVGYDPGKKPEAMLDAPGKAAALGFKGNVNFVNTAPFKQNHGEGVFMQMKKGPEGGHELSCLRNAEMDYSYTKKADGRHYKATATPKPGQSLQTPAVESVPPVQLKVGQRFQPSLKSSGGAGGLQV